MTITQYFNDYKNNSKFRLSFKSGNSATLEDFYNDYIAQIYSNPKIVQNIINWHNMLVEYCKNLNNIFWVRQYESGSSNSNDNRRASLVEFDNGFKILYVSNFDAQEIMNMAVNGVTPDLKEFENLMNQHDYFFHYSKSCAEYNTSSYPNRLEARSFGVLTQAKFYLAHIRSVNACPYYVSGIQYDTKAKTNKTLHDKLYPKGSENDYSVGHTNAKSRVYKPHYSLTSDEEFIIKAHFLRFVDPLNYFPIPGQSYHIYEYSKGSAAHKNIGEFPMLISYMYEKMKKIFSAIDFNQFDKLTCFDTVELNMYDPFELINVAVRTPKHYCLKAKKQNNKTPSSNKNNQPVTYKTRKRGLYSKSKIKIVYIPSGEDTFKKELLIRKKAFITWKYSDGTEKTYQWDVKNFNDKSSVRSNVQSRPEWRKKASTGLICVELKIS